MSDRALRRLATFAREQNVFPGSMDLEDEMRATRLIVRTLRKMPHENRERVLSYIKSIQSFDLVEPPAVPPTTGTSA